MSATSTRRLETGGRVYRPVLFYFHRQNPQNSGNGASNRLLSVSLSVQGRRPLHLDSSASSGYVGEDNGPNREPQRPLAVRLSPRSSVMGTDKSSLLVSGLRSRAGRRRRLSPTARPQDGRELRAPGSPAGNAGWSLRRDRRTEGIGVICPNCASKRIRPSGGCTFCPDCGWSECGGGRA